MISLKFDEPTPSLNLIVNKHWSKAREYKVYWHMMVRAAKGRAKIWSTQPPYERARVTIIRENNRLLDQDNFVGGCKYLIDGLRVHGLIVNDDAQHIEVIYLQRQIQKRDGPRTLVHIEDAGHALKAAA